MINGGKKTHKTLREAEMKFKKKTISAGEEQKTSNAEIKIDKKNEILSVLKCIIWEPLEFTFFKAHFPQIMAHQTEITPLRFPSEEGQRSSFNPDLEPFLPKRNQSPKGPWGVRALPGAAPRQLLALPGSAQSQDKPQVLLRAC